ncbi:MAG: lipopolysaccharide biosynthesis protein [Faecousia sp.]
MRNTVFSGLFWSFGERILAQGISFVLSLVLARLLMPEQYGVVTMVLVFINIANVFVSNGLGESLIQKKDADDTDFSTIFYVSMALSLVLYLILFAVAPWIAQIYRAPELKPVLRVLALKLPIAGINTIQHAYVQKHMQFRKFFFSTLWGTLISGVVGVWMAYRGYGVWALVAQYLVNSTIDTVVLFLTIQWKPRRIFSAASARALVGYGWKLTAASLINTLYSELRSLIIGVKYSTEDLAFFNKGNQLPSLAIVNINTSIGKVIFPAMTKASGDKAQVKAFGRRAMKTTAYLIFPMMAGLMAVAEPLIRLLLTEKWLPCVPYLRLACLYWACQPIQTANWQIIKAMGRSDLCVKLEILKKLIGFSMIFLALPLGVYALAASNTLFAAISMLINIAPNRKLIGYSYFEQLLDLLPSAVSSAVMGVAVCWIGLLPLGDCLLVVIQVAAGIGIYVALSLVTRNESFRYLLDTVKSLLHRKR